MNVGDTVTANTPGKRLHGQTGTITAPIDKGRNGDLGDLGDWWVNFGGPFDGPFLESEITLLESAAK